MKKIALLVAVSAVLLTGCKEEEEKRVLIAQNGEAVFEKQGTFRNCEVGEVRWLNPDGYTSKVNAVVCHNQPSTNVNYRANKVERNAAYIGTVDSEEEAARIKAEAAALARKQAMSKLSDDDRRILGL